MDYSLGHNIIIEVSSEEDMSSNMPGFEEGLREFEQGNYEKAYRLLKPIAENGDPESQCIIANMYHLGLGMEINGPEAVRWYKKSAEQGYGLASSNLSGIFMSGDCGVSPNQVEAERWRKRALEQGFPHTRSPSN